MKRMVCVTAPKGKISSVTKTIEDADGEILGVSRLHDDRRTISFLLGSANQQQLFDEIAKELGQKKDWRMVVQAVEAVVPQDDKSDPDNGGPNAVETREELYEDVADGARFDPARLVLVAVSAVVAAVGMIGDSVTVVIGAMVIAPLLGPILAMILGAALGERALILCALRVAAASFVIALAIGVICGVFVDYDVESSQIAGRTDVGLEGIALALASGAAAALSLTTGVPAVLVGVMVAAALLPPTVAIGLLLGKWLLFSASGAALLFFVNVAAVTLAGQLVFLVQGVRPRTWYKKQAAKQSVVISLVFWTGALVLLVALDYLRSALATTMLYF